MVYWLLPAKPERELFAELIRILAQPFGAPKFEPHITIGRAKNGESARDVLRRLKVAPVHLRIRGVSFSPKFTRTLFVRFHSNPTLEKLVADLLGDAKALPDPHLSLLYKKLPSWAKRELAAAIKLPVRQIRFDSLQAVRCPMPTETRADVNRWRTIATKRLSR